MVQKAHNKTILQKLSNFDFTKEGAHVALVDKAANGQAEFLITKSLAPVQKSYDFIDLVISADSLPEMMERLEEMLEGVDEETVDPTMVNMPLADLLRMVGYLSESEAQKISESVVKSAATLADIEDDVARKEFISKLSSLITTDDSASGAIKKGSKIEEESMSDENKTPEEVEALVKAAEDTKAELEAAKQELETLKKAAEDKEDLAAKVASLEKAADDRVLAAFDEVAKSYEQFGAEEGTGAILKAVSQLEGGEKVLDMLKSAKEAVEKAELLDEVGTDLSDNSSDGYEKIEAIAKTLMKDDDSLTFAQAVVKAASVKPQA